MDLVPHAVQVVRDETLCKNWISSIIWKDYKAVLAESKVLYDMSYNGSIHSLISIMNVGSA